MNVYSVRLIPSLKLKFCEFLGIASTAALSQLVDRVSIMERKMSQMDYRLKHPERLTIQLRPAKIVKIRKSKVISINNVAEEKVIAPAVVSDTVLLINPDEATRQTVREYFGEKVPSAEVGSVQELRVRFQNQKVLAVIFDRSLLGNPVDREEMENLNRDHPQTPLIGLSSYLTLAFSESIPQSIDFVHFLTKPLTVEDLGSILDKKDQRAIS